MKSYNNNKLRQNFPKKGSGIMNTEVLKIRSTVYDAIDRYFKSENFYEIAPPIITSFSCEVACIGGSDLISVNYYDKKAYLSQSGQLYLEALAMQLGQVYCISPTFRAESTSLVSHLSEFWMCEAEMTDITFERLLGNINDLLIAVINLILEKNSSDLKLLGTDVRKLERILRSPFIQVAYSDVIEILKQEHLSVEWGDDIQSSHEMILSKYFDEFPVIITRYPKTLSSFYKQTCLDDSAVTLSFDVIAPKGYGELASGSMRENDVRKLRESLLPKVEMAPYEWYFDLISENQKEHGGYGIGIERLLSWLCNLSTIQDAIPFPRTQGLLCP